MSLRKPVILIASVALLSAAYHFIIVMPRRALQAVDADQRETLDRLANLKRTADERARLRPAEAPTPIATVEPTPKEAPAPAPVPTPSPAVADAIKRLRSPDAQVRRDGALWLAQTPSQFAVEPLTAALTDSDPYVQSWSAKALGNIKPVSVKTIEAVLRVKGQPGFDDGVQESLRSMGIDAILPSLLKTIAGRESLSRSQALSMLIEFGRYIPSPDKPATIAALKSVIVGDTGELQWRAAIGLAEIAPDAPESLPVLVRGMGDESRNIRQQSELALRRLGDAGAAAMRTVPRPPSPDTPEGALWHLDRAGTRDELAAAFGYIQKLGPEAAPVLRRYASDSAKDGQKRMLALNAALRTLPPERRHDELVGAFGSATDDTFRTACLRNIAHNSDPRSKAVVKGAFADPNASGYVKMVAGEILAGMGDDAGKALALQSVLARDSHSAIAARTLAALGATDVIPKLKEASAGAPENAELRSAAIKIELAGLDKAQQVRILKRLLQEPEEKPHLLVKWIAIQLRDIRTPDAIRALDDLSRSKNGNVSWYSSKFLQDSMMTGLLSVAEVKSIVGATPLVKATEELLRMKKAADSPGAKLGK